MTQESPARWSLAKADVRYYGKHRRWAALLRALLAVLLLGHDSELCQECGRRYPLIWWSPQPLWDELLAPKYQGGCAGGLLCPRCFDAKAEAAGLRLNWTPMVVSRDGVPTSNWWCDETRDALMVGEPDPDYFPDGQVRQPQPTWARVKPFVASDVASPYPAENLAEVARG